jgi:uncharacterized membrane protein
MELASALILYAFVVVALYVIFSCCRISCWSALAGALFVGLFVLLACHTPNRMMCYTDSAAGCIYGFLILITIVIVSFYVIERVLADRQQACESIFERFYYYCKTVV